MKYELLANALEPRFGNIYEYNLDGGDPTFDAQPWTDDLKTAVRDYLLHELPPDVARCMSTTDLGALVDEPFGETDVDVLLTSDEPWEVALSVRYAAVRAVPTLDELIGRQENWPSEDDRTDAAVWLDAHHVQDLWEDLATASRYVERLGAVGMLSRRHNPDTWDLVEVLAPQELLAAWRAVVGQAPSDLTDAEWALLVPLLPPATRTERHLNMARRRLDGLRFQHEYGASWDKVSVRYGTTQALLRRRAIFKKLGVFERALKSVESDPAASRLVAWLRAEADLARPFRVERLSDVADPVNQDERYAPAVDAAEARVAQAEPSIEAVSTLDQLIGHLDTWHSDIERMETAIWLERHLDYLSLMLLRKACKRSEFYHADVGTPHGWNSSLIDDLVRILQPPELLAAWQIVVGPAPTDLTDDEWQLLAPHFGPYRNRYGKRPPGNRVLQAKRHTFDAIRLKMAYGLKWAEVPVRYGKSAPAQNYRAYQVGGLFQRLYQALQGNASSELVAWLKVLADGGHEVDPGSRKGKARS